MSNAGQRSPQRGGNPQSEARSAILRAEILRGDAAEITCALEMTGESVFVVTDGLPSFGEIVHLRLSFPRTIRPLLVTARVRQVRMSTGPGSPSGFVADFELESDATRQKVTEFARRIRPAGRALPSRELSVLLVEDNQLIRDMFAYAVEKYFSQRSGRVRLAQAPTVKEASKLLEERRLFDLALVDQMLPDGTGADLVATLRRDPSFRRMPIVGMSVGGASARSAMIEAGADIFLDKPIVLKDLFCTLEFLMDTAGSDRGAA
jgi:CheY-like chemotaxis protein